MSIKASDAIRVARSLIGTPYAKLDCINLIKKVIRDAPGGVKGYTTAGSNTLWNSAGAAAKYRDVTWQQTGLAGAKAGMLAFKEDGGDFHHVGLVTGEGTVVHSSSTQGGRGVVETPLTAKEGWTHLAEHRYIETSSVGYADTFPKGEGSDAKEREMGMESYKAIVSLSDPNSSLNVRNEPGLGGDVINRLFHGQSVTVQAEYENGWAFVSYGDSGQMGYVSGEYLVRAQEEEEEPEELQETTTLINVETGETMMLVGRWRVAED